MDIEKLRKRKFARNILVGFIALGAVALLLNIAPGYKRDAFTDVTNLVINEDNVTEELIQPIYINDKGVIYLSKEDIIKFFDETIYYDTDYNQIITTSETNVATIVLGQMEMVVNDEIVNILDTVICREGIIYIPISEMEEVYNIEISYISQTDFVVIDKLDKGMIIADVTDKTELKFRPRALSKNVGELQEGEEVSCFYTTSKGWRQIRRANGQTGYVKANKLTEGNIVRPDIEKRGEAEKIYISSNGTAKINRDNKTVDIMVKEVFKVIGESGTNISNRPNDNINTEKYELWAIFSNKGTEKQLDIFLADYNLRNELINTILNLVQQNNVKGVNIDFNNVKSHTNFDRFIIELTPRLRDIDKYTCVTINEGMHHDNIKNIVDYIVE